MASLFGHATVGLTLAYQTRRRPSGLWFWMAVSAVLPDVDVFLGFPYGSCWGHRGFTHSVGFALIWAALMALLLKRRGTFWGIYSATLSHPILDALTNGGKGVAALWPLSCERYFFGWRPIEVSPIGVTQFFEGGSASRVLVSEAVWIGIPCIVWVFVTAWSRRGRRQKSPK